MTYANFPCTLCWLTVGQRLFFGPISICFRSPLLWFHSWCVGLPYFIKYLSWGWIILPLVITNWYLVIFTMDKIEVPFGNVWQALCPLSFTCVIGHWLQRPLSPSRAGHYRQQVKRALLIYMISIIAVANTLFLMTSQGEKKEKGVAEKMCHVLKLHVHAALHDRNDKQFS